MAKIPFTLQAWLKDKSQKVENKYGKEVHLLEYDLRPANPFEPMIIGYEERGGENLRYAESDLFIVTPEEEPTEWQRFISACLQKYGLLDCGAADRIAKESAAELLSLAREQFIKDGYVIEKKVFHDAVENISDKHRAEMSVEYSVHCKIEDGTRHAVMNWSEFKKVAQKFIDIGKAEALKDLPRWKKCQEDDPSACVYNCVAREDSLLYYNGHTLRLIDLEKLPGFKEE